MTTSGSSEKRLKFDFGTTLLCFIGLTEEKLINCIPQRRKTASNTPETQKIRYFAVSFVRAFLYRTFCHVLTQSTISRNSSGFQWNKLYIKVITNKKRLFSLFVWQGKLAETQIFSSHWFVCMHGRERKKDISVLLCLPKPNTQLSSLIHSTPDGY